MRCSVIFLLIFCLSAFGIDSTRDPFVPISALSAASFQNNPITPKLESCWIALYFAKANDVAAFLSNKKNLFLSMNGAISADKLNNEIWIRDDVKHLAMIRGIIRHLDQPSPQFLIKAKIINVDHDYERSLGIMFEGSEDIKQSVSGGKKTQPAKLTPKPSQPGEVTVTIAQLDENHVLNMQLSALEQQGHATLISNPSLITLNKKPATIESGAEVPYQEATLSGGTSVSFKKAVLRLQVTPQRMPHHHILLHISLNQDKVSALTVEGVPAIETQQISTQVIVRNRETIVLGGILETTRANQYNGIPVLDQLPAIGGLFRHNTHQTKLQELLIFITPSMMVKVL